MLRLRGTVTQPTSTPLQIPYIQTPHTRQESYFHYRFLKKEREFNVIPIDLLRNSQKNFKLERAFLKEIYPTLTSNSDNIKYQRI